MEFTVYTTALTVVPKGKPLFHELATVIKIEDNAAGPYVVIAQESDEEENSISIDHDMWPVLKKEIESMLAECNLIESDMNSAP